LIDVVSFAEFVRIEENRLPIFIGTFMLTARSVFIDHPERRIIAVLDQEFSHSITGTFHRKVFPRRKGKIGILQK
jgi:hypothetical protein